MELVWIDDFIALNDTGNFTQAAERRHTTQSAYSRRIQRLEEWIGTPLFDRDTRPITLTASGKEFAKRALRLREDILDLKRIAGSVATHIPKAVKIYTTNTIAIGLLSSWLKTNNITNYSLIVSSVTHCVEAVKQGKGDIALIPEFQNDMIEGNFQKAVIAKDNLSFYGAKNQIESVTIKDGTINGQIMMYSPVTAFGILVEKTLKAHGLRISSSPVCESASAEALLAQVKAGLGCAWIPETITDTQDRSYTKTDALPSIPFDIVEIRQNR